MSLSTRWLIGTVIALAALVGAALAVTLVEGGGTADLLAEDTPEGVVQRYLQAIERGDTRTAYSYLTTGSQQGCTAAEFERQARRFEDSGARVILKGSKPVDEGVDVTLRISRLHVNPPLLPSESSDDVRVFLQRDDGQWHLANQPWPLTGCSAPRDTPPEPRRAPAKSPAPAPR